MFFILLTSAAMLRH